MLWYGTSADGNRLNTEMTLNITDVDFITFIHRQFYKHLPKTLKGNVKAGALRTQEVKVGRHIPPLSETLPLFLERFSQFYSRHHFQESDAVIAAAAAHHRLTWIHPFVDGNGRVVRLFTDAYLQNIPVVGYGLWTISRGLSRQRDDYMSSLTWADARRRNDYDGRGFLSNEGLIHFCEFFLLNCLDQIHFMTQCLQLDSFLEHVRGYIH